MIRCLWIRRLARCRSPSATRQSFLGVKGFRGNNHYQIWILGWLPSNGNSVCTQSWTAYSLSFCPCFPTLNKSTSVALAFRAVALSCLMSSPQKASRLSSLGLWAALDLAASHSLWLCSSIFAAFFCSEILLIKWIALNCMSLRCWRCNQFYFLLSLGSPYEYWQYWK
jgi:hypothetical protein